LGLLDGDTLVFPGRGILIITTAGRALLSLTLRHASNFSNSSGLAGTTEGAVPAGMQQAASKAATINAAKSFL
jgi:hypothetical protein